MDYFKIVATKEKRGVYFTVVPHKWELNKILYWPDHLKHSEREKLREDAASTPEDSWVEYSCIVKIRKINNFEEALRLEKQITECTDSEAEEVCFHNVLENKDKNPTDRSYLFEVNNGSSSDNKINIISQVIHQPSSSSLSFITENVDNNQQFQNNDDIDASDILEYEQNVASLSKEMKLLKEDVNKQLSILKQQIGLQHTKTMTYLDKISNQLNLMPSNIIENHTQNNNDLIQALKFPLTECEHITDLDSQIRSDKELRTQLIAALSRIGGKSGQEDGTKIGYKIIDHMFAPEVLINYSWTGVTRGKTGEKKSFQNLEGILDVFYDVIYLADNRHTKQKNNNIFKEGVLKHAKKRSQRKRCQKQENLIETEKNLEQVPNDEEASRE